MYNTNTSCEAGAVSPKKSLSVIFRYLFRGLFRDFPFSVCLFVLCVCVFYELDGLSPGYESCLMSLLSSV